MLVFLVFVLASAVAPTIHSHLVFRFFAGFFGSTPLSCAGGTVADLWNPVQKAYAFPAYAIPAFIGPMVGQIIGSFVPQHLGWRWLEWLMLIMGGAILILVVLMQPETYGNLLLHWKASILRAETGDRRYRAPMELRRESLGQRLLTAIYRPFLWSYTELIIILMSIYLTVVYIVLFTFLDGYTYVFGEPYGLSLGLTNISWAGMLVGIILTGGTVPLVYSWTAKEYQKTGRILPETRLWYAMLGGAPAVPVSLFWMGWTNYVSIIARIITPIILIFLCSLLFLSGLHLLLLLYLVMESCPFSLWPTCISSMHTVYTLLLLWASSSSPDTLLLVFSLLLEDRSMKRLVHITPSPYWDPSVLQWLSFLTCYISMVPRFASIASMQSTWIETRVKKCT